MAAAINVEAWMRARELRRQLAGMAGLPMNPAQLVRRHALLNELTFLEAGSPTVDEPKSPAGRPDQG